MTIKFSLKDRAATEPIKRVRRATDISQGPPPAQEPGQTPNVPPSGAAPAAQTPQGPRVEPLRSALRNAAQPEFRVPPPPNRAAAHAAPGADPDETTFEVPVPQMPDTGDRMMADANDFARHHTDAQMRLGVRKKGFIAGTSYTRDAPGNIKHESYYEMLAAAPSQVTQYTQLLIWCLSKRAELLENGDNSYGNRVKQNALRELIMKLAQGEIPINWTRAVVQRQEQGHESNFAPNPRNKHNQERIKHLESMLDALSEEKDLWMRELKSVGTRPQPAELPEPEPIQMPHIDIEHGATEISAAVAQAGTLLEQTEAELAENRLRLQDKSLLGVIGL